MTQRLGIRKSLDELEKEAWAPKPSMLETPAVMTGLDADRKVVIKDTENRVSLNGIWQMVWAPQDISTFYFIFQSHFCSYLYFHRTCAAIFTISLAST